MEYDDEHSCSNLNMDTKLIVPADTYDSDTTINNFTDPIMTNDGHNRKPARDRTHSLGRVLRNQAQSQDWEPNAPVSRDSRNNHLCSYPRRFFMSGGATQVRRVKIHSQLTVPMKQTFFVQR